VKKFTIEKLGKDEKKYQRATEEVERNIQEVEKEEQTLDLLFKDEMNEQAVVRALIEFGNQPYEDTLDVANYIFSEIEKDGLEDLFDNKLLVSIINEYKHAQSNGDKPDEKYFLYHANPQIGQMAVSLLTEKHQISPNWTKFYQGDILGRNELYKEEVRSSMTYLKLKKVKRLIVENQFDIEKEQSGEDLIILLQTHKHLKELEMQLMKDIGTVIFK
jgi:DNA primase